ncbi:HNH endonuclease, partial [Enterobacter kobei]
DRNRSHWSTSKTPSYTKSVSWQHHPFLELHHIEHHADGGENTLDNLITLCNVCHDEVHRRRISREELIRLL